MANDARKGLNPNQTSAPRPYAAELPKENPCILAKNLYDPSISINASGENRILQSAHPGFSAPFTVH
jgi:hypothetical protein